MAQDEQPQLRMTPAIRCWRHGPLSIPERNPDVDTASLWGIDPNVSPAGRRGFAMEIDPAYPPSRVA